MADQQSNAQPDMAQWLDQLGISQEAREKGSPELYTAINAYHAMGSTLDPYRETDTRDWESIMASDNPLDALIQENQPLYGGPGSIDITKTGGMLVSGAGTPLTSDLTRYHEFGIDPTAPAFVNQVNALPTDTAINRTRSNRLSSLFDTTNKTKPFGGIQVFSEGGETSSKPNTYTADNVKKLAAQILAQNTTSKWTGGLSPEKSAMYMADDLAKSGINDISQVGQGENGIINKLTGEKLQSGYGERTEGNLWSGSFEGKGNTGFGVQFDAKGNPYFYTQGASSNDLVTMFKDDPLLGAAAQIAAGYFGGPWGSAALNAAMGKDPVDIAKSAALSYFGNEAMKGISGSTDVSDLLGKTGADVLGKTAGQYIGSGGKANAADLLLGQGLTAGTSAVTSQLPEFNSLPDYAKTFVNKVIGTTLANKGDLSSEQLLNAAMTAGKQAAASAANTIGPGDLKEFSKDLIPGYFLPGGEGYVASGLNQTYGPTETFDPSAIDWASLYADTSNGSPAGVDVSTYKAQDFGADPNKYWDEYMNTMNQVSNKGGFTSGWQNLGTNKVFIQDDGTGNVIDTVSGNSDALTADQVTALIKNGSLNTADSGYVAATGGTGTTPGGTDVKTTVTPDKKTATTTNSPDWATILGLLGSMGGQETTSTASSQDPYADIKSFEDLGYGELFGPDLNTSIAQHKKTEKR
jgi:hypothetical protein